MGSCRILDHLAKFIDTSKHLQSSKCSIPGLQYTSWFPKKAISYFSPSPSAPVSHFDGSKNLKN